MKISAKGRYAVRILMYLAQNPGVQSLSVVSEKTDVSKKYAEQIVSLLRKAELVTAYRGSGGGYGITKSADEINLYDIFKYTESMIFEENSEPEENFSLKSCFDELNNVILSYLKSVTLRNIIDKEQTRLLNDYVI